MCAVDKNLKLEHKQVSKDLYLLHLLVEALRSIVLVLSEILARSNVPNSIPMFHNFRHAFQKLHEYLLPDKANATQLQIFFSEADEANSTDIQLH